MISEIRLTDDDPTVWGRCDVCCRTGLGRKPGPYFSKAYTKRKWERQPLCENCDTPMTFIYEVGGG